jgi:hypothetical protein
MPQANAPPLMIVGWASRHWCQVKAEAQMSRDLAALRRCR